MGKRQIGEKRGVEGEERGDLGVRWEDGGE